MKRTLNKTWIIAFCAVLSACSDTSEKKLGGDQQVEDILKGMTLKEKIGQMTQLNIDVISKGEIYQLKEPHELDSAKLHKAIVEYGVGSILNAGSHAYSLEHWRDIISQIQQVAVIKTRSGIPVLYGIDAIHGAGYLQNGTLFPQPLAQAATFNHRLVMRGAEITAYETRASGIPWNFSPVLDVARQPLWSRVFETYGEDVHLCTVMGRAAIEGYQGEGVPEKVGACLKHFVGYSMPFTGKDRTSVKVSERELREYFLPSFQAAIDDGAMSIMVNSGDLNGIPVHADPTILTDLLRNELGFEGLVVTDWEDIMKLEHPHRVAKSLKDAVRMAVEAGIDMSMVPNDYRFSDLLLELVKEGTISEQRIDESVRRILKMKIQLNLFNQPFTPDSVSYPKVASKEFLEASYQTAAEAITLLKNANNILPLKADTRVVVTGAASNSINMVNGAWTRTWQGTETEWNDTSKQTIADAMSQVGTQVSWAKNAMNSASESDCIVVCLGETPSTEKPGDIHSLKMEQKQLDYVKALATLGKPIVLVLVENRPRVIREIEPLCAAIIMAYQPSENGTKALADIIYGVVNPSGRLPITYPRYVNSLIPYDHRYTDRLHTDFSENAFDPQWEFGHGLSYSTFVYDDLRVKHHAQTDSVQVDVRITNTSELYGKETVLLFVSDQVASVAPPVKRLKAFTKVEMDSQDTVLVRFLLGKHDFAFVGRDNEWVVEPGDFVFQVGPLSDTLNYSPKH